MYGNLVRYTPPQAGKTEEFTSYGITLINSITTVNKDTLALATANGINGAPAELSERTLQEVFFPPFKDCLDA